MTMTGCWLTLIVLLHAQTWLHPNSLDSDICDPSRTSSHRAALHMHMVQIVSLESVLRCLRLLRCFGTAQTSLHWFFPLPLFLSFQGLSRAQRNCDMGTYFFSIKIPAISQSLCRCFGHKSTGMPLKGLGNRFCYFLYNWKKQRLRKSKRQGLKW